MFSLCNKKDYITAGADYKRAFALIKLLRLVDDSVPNDLVYLYMNDTDMQQWQIWDSVIPYEHWNKHSENESCDKCESRKQRLIIPEPIRKMARGYMTYCFWMQAASIIDMLAYGPTRRGNGIVENVQLYPRYVRQALDTLVVPYKAELIQLRHEIDVLHSAISPVSFQTKAAPYEPYRINTDRNASYVRDDDQMSTLTRNQMAKLDTLRGLLCQTCFFGRDRQGTIPDLYTRQILCNLLEIFLCIEGCELTFTKRRNYKMISDFASSSRTEIGFCGSLSPKNDHRFDAEVNKTVVDCSHLSPQAAICFGNGIRFNFLMDNCCGSMCRVTEGLAAVSKVFNTKPINEVVNFIEAESEIQRDKIREYIKRNGGKMPSRCSDCDYEECAPAPADPCYCR